MGFLKRLLKNRLFLSFLGILFLSLFIWFAGPLIGFRGTAPLESSYHRLLAIGSLSTLWLLTAAFRFLRARRRNAQMLASLADDSLSPEDEASSEELATLQSKMQDAIDVLKTRNFAKSGGSRFLYELPWYVIIGPPGAGKTTLLSNSGLEFPLEESHGKYSVKGVGGTRNCDWWFTDQAVLLDTAGRYATQDSEKSVDSRAWSGFLELLREKRNRRPINGVLLAISIEDIIRLDDDALAQMAKTLRARIEELYTQLGIAPPVYLMFTKCDLLAGFSEFFQDLDREARKQVWGFTFPLDAPHSADLASDWLDELADRLGRQSLDKLQRETSQRNREHIYGFPLQFSAALDGIKRFYQQVSAQSTLLEAVQFRGIYLTSATQTGTALDQVIQRVSRNFGIDEGLGPQHSGEGKSFFINTLLDKVVFREAGLAGTNLKTERRLKWLQRGIAALLLALLGGVLTAWAAGYHANRRLIDEIEANSAALRSEVDGLASDSIDLVDASRVLDRAAALVDTSSARSFALTRVGLSQAGKIRELADSKYRDLLIDVLLPRLLTRLEHQMHAQSTHSEFLFEALKTYLMIGDRDRFDSDAVTGWFHFDIDTNLPPDTPAETRAHLKRHTAVLFENKPYRLPRPLDQGLVSQYRLIAASVPLADRAYQRIRRSGEADDNRFLRLSDSVGPDLATVFVRSDGVSLDQSVPTLFTVAGYRDRFLPASRDISATLADDAWVLGNVPAIDAATLSGEQLQQAVQQRYYDEYIAAWDGLFDQLGMRPVGGLQQASQLISLVSDVDSPLKRLLVTAAGQTTLTRPPAPTADGNAADATNRASELSALLGGNAPSATVVEVPLDPVTRHFESLHRLVDGVEKNASSLDQVLAQLAEINPQLMSMAQSPSGATDPALNTELAVNLQKLTTKTGRLPEPLASLVTAITNDIGDVVGGGFCQQLDRAWKSDVYPYYVRAIANRYPVNRNGTADIALTDFGAFFGRGGILDSFVTTYLEAHVSKTADQWTWTRRDSAVCLSDNSLRQLALADDIRNTFFAAGGTQPGFRFDVVPGALAMSPAIDRMILEVGNDRLEFFHGPVNGSTSFVWPDDSNVLQARLRVEPVVPGSSSSVEFSGPWAVLRLFDQGARTPLRNGLRVGYSFGGRSLELELATSSFNPLNAVALRNFRAPEDL